jgi:hypothetical protein
VPPEPPAELLPRPALGLVVPPGDPVLVPAPVAAPPVAADPLEVPADAPDAPPAPPPPKSNTIAGRKTTNWTAIPSKWIALLSSFSAAPMERVAA